VSDNIAERVLGHAIAGVEGVYNRFNYIDEKADALDRLAQLIDRIVNPPDRTNVVAIPRSTGSRSRDSIGSPGAHSRLGELGRGLPGPKNTRKGC
jgi:hypothetical protein